MQLTNNLRNNQNYVLSNKLSKKVLLKYYSHPIVVIFFIGLFVIYVFPIVLLLHLFFRELWFDITRGLEDDLILAFILFESILISSLFYIFLILYKAKKILKYNFSKKSMLIIEEPKWKNKKDLHKFEKEIKDAIKNEEQIYIALTNKYETHKQFKK